MNESSKDIEARVYRRGADGGGLVRRLTLAHAVLYGLGVTIGAGIYVLVGVAAGRGGMYAPLGFLAAAAAMGLTAASFAELGSRIPVSASEAAYVDAAFHRRWLTIFMGLLVIAGGIIGAATISAGSVSYISVFVQIPSAWIIVGVVLTMGFIAGLATTQSIAFAGLMTLIAHRSDPHKDARTISACRGFQLSAPGRLCGLAHVHTPVRVRQPLLRRAS